MSVARIFFVLPITAGLALTSLFSCGKDSPTKPEPPEPPPPVSPVATRIEITPSSARLNAIGQTVQLTATVYDQNNNPMTGAALTWSSSDASVATVSTQGLVTAVGNGTSHITATSGSASSGIDVRVMQEAGSIVIEPMAVMLMSIGETVQLTATVLDGNGQPVVGAALTWQSGDESVAAVSAQGLVTAVGNGVARITATSGIASSGIDVRVMQEAGSIVIEPMAVMLMSIGETIQLTATVLDGNGQPVEGAAVTWSSGDASVASVDAGGLVTALSNGVARITATSGSASSGIDVRVMQEAGSIVIEPMAVMLMSIGETIQLTATVLDGNGQPVEGAAVTWSSGDASVASVDAGGLVTALSNGVARITATSGSASSGIDVRVMQTADSIVIGPEEVMLMSIGETVQLTATVLDGNGQPVADVTVTWESGDASVATVSAQGLVTAVRNGVARITATSGSASAGIDVRVMQEAGSIVIGPEEVMLMSIGETVQLTATVLDGNGQPVADVTVTWESGDASVATVSAQGLVTAVRNGVARITATSGSASAGIDVRVMQEAGSIVIGPEEVMLMSIGETVQLTATVLDGNGQPVADVTVTWESGDASVATVSAQGLVTAVRNGVARITATSGSASAGIDVRVMQEAGSIVIEPMAVMLMSIGETVQLTATVLDGNGQPVVGAALTWQSGDASVASIDAGGLVTALSNGVARIMATSGSASESVEITVQARTPSPDRDVLIALYNALDGENWTNNTNWLSDKPLGNWYGVSVDSVGRVVNLELFENNLKGTIPPAVGRLVKLQTLFLYGNSLEGIIPPEIGLLRNLRRLILSGNQLTGNIPAELGNLVNLLSLKLAANNLSGTIPVELGNLINVYYLSLLGNELTGSIPAEFGNLSSLSVLKLEINRLSGRIPAELGSLTGLNWLILRDNQLTGSIPAELGKLPYLNRLDLSSNKLSGRIPSELGNLTKMRTLFLYSNQLTGSIPPELGQMTNLVQLDLSANKLEGSIPPVYGDLINLKALLLSDNSRLTGAVPVSLIDIDLDTIELSGTLLCLPKDSEFQDWYNSITNRSRIAECRT